VEAEDSFVGTYAFPGGRDDRFARWNPLTCRLEAADSKDGGEPGRAEFAEDFPTRTHCRRELFIEKITQL
jgi:hypothetical protein